MFFIHRSLWLFNTIDKALFAKEALSNNKRRITDQTAILEIVSVLSFYFSILLPLRWEFPNPNVVILVYSMTWLLEVRTEMDDRYMEDGRFLGVASVGLFWSIKGLPLEKNYRMRRVVGVLWLMFVLSIRWLLDFGKYCRSYPLLVVIKYYLKAYIGEENTLL